MAKTTYSLQQLKNMKKYFHLLTDRERQAFILFHCRDWRIEDIAAEMNGINRSTVDRKLQSARQKLLPYK